MEIIKLVLIFAAGGALTGCGWWLLLRASDKRLNSRVRNLRWPGTSKQEEAAGRELEAAMFGVVVKLIGSVLLLAGLGMIIQHCQAG